MGAGNSAAMPMMTALSPWLRAIILPSLILLSCQPVLAAEEKIIAGENEDKPAVKSSSSQAATTAVNFQGTYSAVVTGGTIGLHLEQAGEKVTGRLKGINAVYEMTGSLRQDGRVVGIANSAKGKLYFSGQKEGRQIKLLFAEPAANGTIDQDKTRLILFTPGSLSASTVRQKALQAQLIQQPANPAAQAGLVGTKQCGQEHSACMTACSRVGGGITGMNQCIATRCQPSYQKCMAGRQPNVTAADREWANQLSNSSAQIHQQRMQSYQQQIDSTHNFSRQQEERLNRERFGN